MTYPDFSSGEVLTSSDMDRIGLWRITSTTIPASPAQTSVTVSNCFPSDFRTFLVQIVNVKGGAQVGGALQLSGITTGYDYSGFYQVRGSAAIVGFTSSGVGSWDTGALDTNASFHELVIMNPNVAAAKTVLVRSSASGTTTLGVQVFGANASTATATGFVFSVGSSNFTGGTIHVYGYNRNS